jgi:carbon storage regulator
MLILTRRLGECLKIGELGDVLEGPVTIKVLGTKGNQVRIGVAAQRDVRVDREEIRHRIDRESPAAIAFGKSST